MSDRPSRRSPPASSRSMAAARSSDWMFRAIAVLPPSPTTADWRRRAAVRQCRTLPVDVDLSLTVGRDRFPDSRPAHRVQAIIVRPVDSLNIRARSRLP
ncbi:hypothetical protein GCM10010280_52140 [Streptomyces pilosus]|uniref:Uncharacterized protein n=1 Tax=Streptomyces pilosus TaxID=28893 RepID=A0A918BZB7_9ACTN|nr:hypothetical protein GCM10010280_52140 [Streptomyces pilosus]